MIGIDEVGRGAWAGPLLIVAARPKTGCKLPEGLRDSKKLSLKQREAFALEIAQCCDIGQGWVAASVIDGIGLATALRSATMLALLNLNAEFDDEIIIDGSSNFLANTNYSNATCLIKADDTVPIVSAASIVAKVLRDKLMAEYDADYPAYGFARNVGYGTKSHITAIDKNGVCILHRRSYKPLQKYLLCSS